MTMSSNDLKNESNECPICTDQLTLSSKKYPILCATQACHFNMCSKCLEQLCISSNSALGRASDGSFSVKVRLQCPACRGDLGKTARCTLILRESVEAELLQDVKDSDLSAAQLRLKYLLDDPEELGKISSAKRNYEKGNGENGFEFMHDSGQLVACGSAADSDPLPDISFDDFFSEDIKEENERIVPTTVDLTVFSGLEHAMSLAEKDFVYSLMTSGKPQLLVEAVETLSNIANMALKGLTPSRHTEEDALSKSNSSESSLSQSPSRYRRAHGYRSGYSCSSLPKASRSRRNSDEREIECAKAAARLVEWKRIRPLPLRMPRFLSITLDQFGDILKPRKCCLNFVDHFETNDEVNEDQENPSKKDYRIVADAYKNFHVDWMGNIQRLPLEETLSDGVNSMVQARMLAREKVLLDQSDHSNTSIHTQILNPPSRRVVITHTRSIAAQKGIQRGDVITHINGEPFIGGAEQLRCLISKLQRESLGKSKSGKDLEDANTLKIVVNAEASVAEVLRLRIKY